MQGIECISRRWQRAGVVSCCATGDTLRVTLDPEGVTHVHQFILMYSICLCTNKYRLQFIYLAQPTGPSVTDGRKGSPLRVAGGWDGGGWGRPARTRLLGTSPADPKMQMFLSPIESFWRTFSLTTVPLIFVSHNYYQQKTSILIICKFCL